jgi:hypothetical protein
LKTIKKRAIESKSWDDFIKVLKNSNPKNKNSKGK